MLLSIKEVIEYAQYLLLFDCTEDLCVEPTEGISSGV